MSSATTPTLVLERDTARIINTSSQRVWVSSSGSIGPGSSTPVEGYTSYQAGADGPVTLYAALDPAATLPVDLIVDDGRDPWQPSPLLIATQTAVQTAVQLAATGIRTRQVFDPLGNYSISPGTTTLDTSAAGYNGMDQYGTVFVYFVAPNNLSLPPSPIQYQWGAGGVGDLIGRTDYMPFKAVGNSYYTPGFLIPVYGRTLKITNSNIFPVTAVVYGINQVLAQHPIGNGFSSLGFIASCSIPANTPIGNQPMTIVAGTPFQGPARYFAQVSYGSSQTAIDPLSFLFQFAGISNNFFITDSAHLSQYTPTSFTAYDTTAFPAGEFQLYARNSSAVASNRTVTLQAIPAY